MRERTRGLGEGAIIVSVTVITEAWQQGSAGRGGAGLRPAAHSLWPFSGRASQARMGGGEAEGGSNCQTSPLGAII